MAFTWYKQTPRCFFVLFGRVFSQIGCVDEGDSSIFVSLNQRSRVRFELSRNAILNFAFVVEKTVRISSPRHYPHEKSITKLHNGKTKGYFSSFYELMEKRIVLDIRQKYGKFKIIFEFWRNFN